jgi:hypothetical protein
MACAIQMSSIQSVWIRDHMGHTIVQGYMANSCVALLFVRYVPEHGTRVDTEMTRSDRTTRPPRIR